MHDSAHRFRSALASLAIPASLALLAAVAGCAGTPKASAPESAPIVGTWTSDLDGATLAVEGTGLFSIDVPARASAAAHAVVGRWTYDEDAKSATFTNLAGSAACPEVPGEYKVEIVRDTVRFNKVKDSCPAREEHMAWAWKKAEAQGARKP